MDITSTADIPATITGVRTAAAITRLRIHRRHRMVVEAVATAEAAGTGDTNYDKFYIP
jgi:hypothetical protein